MPKKGATKVLDVPARVTMNERPLEGEGGRVVVHAVDGLLPDGHRQVEVILNLATDEAMEPYPETSIDRRDRQFRIVVYEEGALDEDTRKAVNRGR